MTPPTTWEGLGEAIEAAARSAQAEGRPARAGADEVAQVLSVGLSPWLDGTASLSLTDLLAALPGGIVHRSALGEREALEAERWLTPEACRFMAAEVAAYGDREISFLLTLLPGDRQFGQPRVSFRGSRSRSFFCYGDALDLLEAGAVRVLDLHTHPDGDLEPSEKDLDGIGNAVTHGRRLGFGILSPEADRLYLVRPPLAWDPATTGEG